MSYVVELPSDEVIGISSGKQTIKKIKSNLFWKAAGGGGGGAALQVRHYLIRDQDTAGTVKQKQIIRFECVLIHIILGAKKTLPDFLREYKELQLLLVLNRDSNGRRCCTLLSKHSGKNTDRREKKESLNDINN